MRKPGCRPLDLPPLTFQPSSEIESNRSGPRTSSAVESVRAPDAIDEPARVGHLVDGVHVAARERRAACQGSRMCSRRSRSRSNPRSARPSTRRATCRRRRDRIVRVERRASATTAGWIASSSASKRQRADDGGDRRLKDIAEHDIKMLAVAAAEPRVDPQDRAVVRVESEAEAVVVLRGP